ncbi:MAG TPA: flavin reductase family protein [Gemmatimonadales bacterium]|nr:flavin reductase family protein [Gemmatimonadales bacterium]
MSAPEVDPAQFRQLLGRFATGVTILTVVTPGGRPIGMTATSLSSVSLRPPLISVGVDREADMHDAILKAGEFVVNVLSSPQETLARRFADEHEDRFDGVGYHLSPDGLILLDGALAHIECHRHAHYQAGDHTIVVGQVVGGATSDGRPLLYYRGGYAALG